MPDVGASVDRRALTEAVRVTGQIRCLVCFACGQVNLDNGDESSSEITLSPKNSAMLDRIEVWSENKEALSYNLSMDFFKKTYVQGASENPWRHNAECFAPGDWEWRRSFKFSKYRHGCMEMLCVPEDVEHCGGQHSSTTICKECSVPLCSSCKGYLLNAFAAKNLAYANETHFQKTGERRVLEYCIPMALANDNMWGYSSSILVRYKVRWIPPPPLLFLDAARNFKLDVSRSGSSCDHALRDIAMALPWQCHGIVMRMS